MLARFDGSRALALLTCVGLLASACADNRGPALMVASPAAVGRAPVAQESAEASSATPAAERMVIKTAALVLVSDAPEDAAARARAAVEGVGGFVVRSETHPWNENANSFSLVLRVPADRFDAVLGELRGLGEVDSETIGGQDVTEEYLDVQALLRNQKALEARFLELLALATNVTETLEIERELARVRMEIDRIEGRGKFLRDQVALSTIHFTANPTPKLARSVPTIGREASAAFGDSGRIVAIVVGGMIRSTAALLPILVVVGAGVVALRAILRLRRKT